VVLTQTTLLVVLQATPFMEEQVMTLFQPKLEQISLKEMGEMT
jgi:hypothetical protein